MRRTLEEHSAETLKSAPLESRRLPCCRQVCLNFHVVVECTRTIVHLHDRTQDTDEVEGSRRCKYARASFAIKVRCNVHRDLAGRQTTSQTRLLKPAVG